MSRWVKGRDLLLLGGGLLTGFWMYGQLIEWLDQRRLPETQRWAATVDKAGLIDLGVHRHDGEEWGRAT